MQIVVALEKLSSLSMEKVDIFIYLCAQVATKESNEKNYCNGS